MAKLFIEFQKEVIITCVLLAALLVLRNILSAAIRRFAEKGDIQNHRTQIIEKYTNISLNTIVFISIVIIWGVRPEHIWVVFSSLFTVIGVALFAQWSLLSNVTAGIIIFFSTPFRIGNYIKIIDKDFPLVAEIEDIRAFHIYLKTKSGEVIIYPNNLILQKGIAIVNSLEESENNI